MRNLLKILLVIVFIILLSFTSDSFIEPDDYPVTDNLLKKYNKDKVIDSVFSYDKVWFQNKIINEVLIFELYTDYHRYAIFHCKKDFIFSDFIKRVLFERKIGNSSFDLEEKEKNNLIWKKFIEGSVEIKKSYFTTVQDMKLGVGKTAAIKKYGKPTRDSLINTISILEWDFQGDITIAETGEKPIGRIAKNSFGYHVVMYFKKENLAAMILYNDIP